MCFLPLRHHRNNSWLSTTGADADAFFNIISSSQARRLDDQRVALPALPGMSRNAESKGNGKNTKAGIPVSYRTNYCCYEYKEYSQMLLNLIFFLTCCFINKRLWFKKAQLLLQGTQQLSGPFLLLDYKAPPPLITVAESTPTSSRKDCSRPASQPQRASPRTIPKSASFTPETEYQKNLNSPAQVNPVLLSGWSITTNMMFSKPF